MGCSGCAFRLMLCTTRTWSMLRYTTRRLIGVSQSQSLDFMSYPLTSFYHPHSICRISLNLGIVCLTANIIIILYLTIWLPLVVKITIPWDKYCPRMIPAATILGIFSIILFMMAFWPKYGLLTPLIIITLCMGTIFSAHFIPWPC